MQIIVQVDPVLRPLREAHNTSKRLLFPSSFFLSLTAVVLSIASALASFEVGGQPRECCTNPNFLLQATLQLKEENRWRGREARGVQRGLGRGGGAERSPHKCAQLRVLHSLHGKKRTKVCSEGPAERWTTNDVTSAAVPSHPLTCIHTK